MSMALNKWIMNTKLSKFFFILVEIIPRVKNCFNFIRKVISISNNWSFFIVLAFFIVKMIRSLNWRVKRERRKEKKTKLGRLMFSIVVNRRRIQLIYAIYFGSFVCLTAGRISPTRESSRPCKRREFVNGS